MSSVQRHKRHKRPKPSKRSRRSRRSVSPFLAGGVFPIVLLLVSTPWAFAQVPPPLDPLSFEGPDVTAQFKDIKIEQRLDAQVPLDLPFIDEGGKAVQLGDYLGERPAILTLIYYDCPMLCPMILKDVGIALKAIKYGVGDEFDTITVSINPRETPVQATAMKAMQIEALGRPGAEKGWHFLTGEEDAIDRLADAVGFRYAYDSNTGQYAHAAGIMVLTPKGKVSRYFYGLEYIPRDVEFALIEASEGKIGSLVDQIVLLCFAYDPATGTYGFYVLGAMRVGAVLTVLALLLFWLTHYLKTRGQPQSVPENGSTDPEVVDDRDPGSTK